MLATSELFKILAGDKRIEIIEQLKNKSMTVNALARALGISQSAVSQHLRILRSAGLVNNERQGYFTHYSINETALEKCRQRLNRVCTCGCLNGKRR